jgi:hypothetical protein
MNLEHYHYTALTVRWVVGLFTGHLSPKRAPLQIGIDWRFHLRKVPRRRRISHTYAMLLWGQSLFKILTLGPVLHGTKWLLWCPHIQSLTLHLRRGINKGLIKRGSTTDHWRLRCKGWILWPTPHTYYIPLHPAIHPFKMVSQGQCSVLVTQNLP